VQLFKMKTTYNFNIEIEVPPKTNQEELLFLKWKPILRRFHISPEIIEEYKKDLLSLKINKKNNQYDLH